MSKQRTVDLLKMYNKPEIWGNESIFQEVDAALDKISADSDLKERECFIVSELTKGLLDVVETTLSNTTDEGAKAALLETVAGILQFIQYLDNNNS